MRRSTESWNGTNCKGLTLIEVVASLLLVSTLLVMVLEGWSRHRGQIERARWNKQAAIELDRLLANWFSSQRPFPCDQTGGFSTSPELFWRSRFERRLSTNPDWPTGVLNVAVYRRRDSTAPLVSIELLWQRAALQ